MVYKSSNTIKQILGNPKDKIEEKQKSGIYSVTCAECDSVYIGQTIRSVETRVKEHFAHARNSGKGKSAVADLMWDELHVKTSMDNAKLIKPIHNNYLMDAWESLHIHKAHLSFQSPSFLKPISASKSYI